MLSGRHPHRQIDTPAGGSSGGRRADGETVVPRRRMQQRAQRAFVRAALMLLVVAPVAQAGQVTAADLREQLRKERVQRDQLRAELRDARRIVRPTVDHAIHLAAKAFGVSLRDMRTVARCESTFNPHARNGKYLGLFQAGPAFWAATPFTAFDRTDPYANALATAMVVAREGWSQWECKP